MKREEILIPHELERTLAEILRIPVAPFQEEWLIQAILDRFHKEKRIKTQQDRFGNILLNYRPDKSKKAYLCLQAHLDHPGFVLRGLGKSGKRIGEIRGGMSRNLKGATLTFFQDPEKKGTNATILRSFEKDNSRFVTLDFHGEIPPPEGTLGMYNYPPMVQIGDYLEGRSFDDTLGVAIIIAVIEAAITEDFLRGFDVIFTRAEEVGFVGAMNLVSQKTFSLPRNILTVEMPRAGSGLKAGDGAIIRTGDRGMNYDNDLLMWLQFVADRLCTEDPTLKYQRRLAWKGWTESIAFLLHGYRATSLCLPVINAHNKDSRSKPAPERIHIGDMLSMFALLKEVVTLKIQPGLLRRRMKKSLTQRALDKAHLLHLQD